MRTKPLIESVVKTTFYILVLLWTSYSAYAQCPTINTPAPSVCEAAGFTFSDLDAFADDLGNGIRWYSTATGGMPFNDNELVSEGTYFAGDDSGTCGTRESLTVDFTVDASGQNLDAVYCSNENPTIQLYIDQTLSPVIPVGGSVEVYNDFELTSLANGTDLIPIGGTNYFIVFVSGGCRSQIEIGTTATFEAPADPTPTDPQTFCAANNPTIADLDPGTADAFVWFDNIDSSGDPIQPPLATTSLLVDGNTYYVQAVDIFCDSNPIPVTVNLDMPTDPGTSGSRDFCIDDIPTTPDFNLFDELSGTPVTTGTWTGPLATANGHLGTVNVTTLTTPGTYVFTYTVPTNGTCPEGTSTVTITVFDNFTSGTPSADNPASFCVSDLPGAFDLFTLLEGEDPGGVWTEGNSSSGTVVGSTIDFTGFAPATYDYTYTQNLSPNACPEESTTVQVIVLPDPNAGVAVNATFCENDLAANSPFNLFNTLDGSQDDNNGTWTDANGDVVTDSTNLDITTLPVGTTQFTYTIDNGACSDMETTSITVEPAPESGTVNSSPEFCEGEGSATFDLFDLLDGEDQAGTWFIGSDNTGATTSNIIDLSILAPNTYTYTYDVDAIGSCDDSLVTVTIIINPLPNTGTPTAATFCENDVASNSPLDLFGQLAGNDTGGTWTDDDVTGALSGSDVDLTILPIGSYNFTYSITSPEGCSNSSTVVINILEAPESGTVNAPAVFCAADITTGQTFDLFDLLEGEDQSGVWADDDASGALSGNTVTLDGLPAGTYNFTFDVNAIGTCDDVLVTVSITINDTLTPTGPITQAFCDSATIANLTATGTTIQWYDVATGGSPLADTTALIDGTTYYAAQTDATTGCESSVRLAVTVTIFATPITGNPSDPPLLECNDNTSIDLNLGLDGTQDAGGVWQDDDSTGRVTGNIFDASGIAPGTYQFTYFIAASAPCVDASTTITVTIEQALNRGSDASTNICADSGTIDLFPLLGGADVGGVWSPALASGTGVFDPTVDAAGTYTYELTNACGTFSSDVTVTVTQPANAGGDNTGSVCVIDGAFDLTTALTGTPDSNGTWSPALASGTNIFDPAVDVSGTYTYTVLATSPCSTDASAVLTITVQDTVEPTVVNATPSFCVIDNPTVADLNSSLSFTGTINWYTDDTLTTLLDETDALIDGEDYFATQTLAGGCESSLSVMLIVTINDSPPPTLIDVGEEYCINDGPTINDLSLNIAENNSAAFTLVWYDAATGGNVVSGSTSLTNGNTYYAALMDAVTGCESSIRLAVTPDLTSCGDIIIPDGFSPNGDGVNDTFDIDNLEILYPNFEMEIFNRNGNTVYKGNASSPRFDGRSNQSSLGSQVLPVGVYFYVFTFNNGENRPIQGRLYLSR